MTEIPDDEVEVAAKAIYEHGWAAAGDLWETLPNTSKQEWRHDAGAMLGAVRPRWEKQLAELRSERDDAALRWGEHYNAKLAAVEAERDAARAELERVRAEEGALGERHHKMRYALSHLRAWKDGVTGRTMVYADDVLAILNADVSATALRPVPEQEQQ